MTTETSQSVNLVGAIPLAEIEVAPIQLGLQGPPGSGKTTAALTFPNPVVLDFDKGLQAHVGREGARTVPFYSADWVLSYMGGKFKPTLQGATPNRRDALKHWLDNEARKLRADETLILDSWSAVQDAFDMETRLVPRHTKKGEIDDYAFWDDKIEYARYIFVTLQGLRCHSIVTFHETKVRDPKNGILLEKIEPLMQGKFVARIKQFFSDYYRCSCESSDTKDAAGKAAVKHNYLWQVNSNSMFDAKRRALKTDLVFVPASYQSFVTFK